MGYSAGQLFLKRMRVSLLDLGVTVRSWLSDDKNGGADL